MELPFDDEGKRRDLNGRKGKAAAEPSSSSSPATRTIDKPSFDVFLSFRGEDTRKSFTSHLYDTLCQCGISTFIDSEELEKGERIEELFYYIEASKIFVPVLSKGYADSRWCLREITKMVERDCGRLILPIFFNVNPTHVRNQSGPFEAAFQRHESSNKVEKEDLKKWKDALRAVGEIKGHSLQNDTNGNEALLIGKVVEQISLKLNKTARPIPEHLVGMDSHIDKMYRLLDLTDKEVKMIGIVGMGGVGKTTLATVVYNKLLSVFKDNSFISNVRENFKHHNGGVALQQRLIKDILKDKHPDVADVEHGATLIEARFCSKRVLVILDDADHIKQLEALAGERNWFGSGSRIIITSRDSRVLLEHGVGKEHIYRPEVLDDKNSIKLFNSCAFRGVRPIESKYVELSKEVVKRTGGLPLALRVFGSHLWRRNIKEWKEFLRKLLQEPDDHVGGRLRISYDGLEQKVKQIFLDISCFFLGEQKEYATYMWEACGLYPETAITELQERSLINVNEYDEFEMHDLLRDMGRGIVAQQGEPWQRSRLWNSDDLLQSLAYKCPQDKSRMAEGIVIAPGYTEGHMHTPTNNSEAHLSTEEFVDFSCLRLLHLSRFALHGEFLCLPRRLKWLRLYNCQFLNRLSGASNLNGISVLELVQVDDVARILIEQSSSSRKTFDALKVLHLEYSRMTRTPDFSKIKMIRLRKLILRNCKKLTKVDGSIGSLKRLVHLELRHCDKLQRLPDSICTLMSLETLILIHCQRLSSLPEKLGDMKSLRQLLADNTGISAVPDSIGNLSNLRTLSLNWNDHLKKLPNSMRMLDSLEELYIDGLGGWLFGDGLAVVRCIECAGSELFTVLPNPACEKVKELTLEDHRIQELPPYLGRLTNLEALSIRCYNLIALPESLGQLQKLKSFELKSDCLEVLPAMAGRTFENLRSLVLNCPALKHVPDWIASLGRLEKLSLTGSCGITFLPTSMAHAIGTHCHFSLPLTQTVSDSPFFFLTPLINFPQVQEFRLEGCENLQSLPPVPSSLHVLDARGCNKLRTISDVSNLKSLRELKLGGCGWLGDFWGLESIVHNLETLELPGPCGGLSGFSQLSPAFLTRVFKGAAFSSLMTFRVFASRQYGEAIPCHSDHHQPLWFMFPKVGRGGKRPTSVKCTFFPTWFREEQKRSMSISIMEEDGHAVYQCTAGDLDEWIRGEEIVDYSGEGYYLRMQVTGPTSFLNEIRQQLSHVYVIVRYT